MEKISENEYKSVNWSVCICVCLIKQGGLWRSYDCGSVGSSRGSPAAERETGKRFREGGGKHAWKYHHIVMHHWFPIHHKPVQPVPSSPNPPIQGFTLTHVCVCDFTWVFLEEVQGALELAWRVNEEQQHWNLLRKPSGQTQDGRALGALRTLVRGWEGAAGLVRGLSLLGVGWQREPLLLVGDWNPEKTA